MIPRVYVDTSVIGGCLDEEFGTYSERLADDFDQGRFRAVISDVTLAEMETAPLRSGSFSPVRALPRPRG
jgi:hypothetical protein